MTYSERRAKILACNLGKGKALHGGFDVDNPSLAILPCHWYGVTVIVFYSEFFFMVATDIEAGTTSARGQIHTYAGLLFDMDGTLIDSTDAIVKHWQK